MKTTSFLISKKLAEIGLPQGQFLCNKHGRWIADFGNDLEDGDFWAYDLETILEALPETIANAKLDRIEAFEMRKTHLLYDCLHTDKPDFICYKQENESLADCAARLLILLHEKGLINFEVENE